MCPKCKSTTTKQFKEVVQNIYCKYCDSLVTTKIKKQTKSIVDLHNGICDSCKNMLRKKASIRMKVNNPMFDPNVRIKVSETKTGGLKDYDPYEYLKPKETKDELVNRMKTNNPMFHEDVKKKALKTLKEHILSGKITYKKGQDNPL